MTTTQDPSVLAQLNKMKNAWNQAKTSQVAQTDGYTNLPDGNFNLELDTAELGFAQSSGRLQVHWGWTVWEGELTGQRHHEYDGLDDPDRLAYLLRKLRRFGLDINQLEITDLPQLLPQLLQHKLRIQAKLQTSPSKTTGELFQKTWINIVYNPLGVSPEGTDQATSASAKVEEDEPSPSSAEDHPIKVGSRVQYTMEGVERSGIVKDLDMANGKATVLTAGKKYTLEIDELEIVG